MQIKAIKKLSNDKEKKQSTEKMLVSEDEQETNEELFNGFH